MPDTPLLDTVRIPADTRDFSVKQLQQLAEEVRAETIDAVSVTGATWARGWAWSSCRWRCTMCSKRPATS